MTAESKIEELGLTLPPTAEPKGLYKPLLVVENRALTSGHLPVTSDGSLITGRVGADMDVEAAAEAARLTGLAILATLRAELGSLDRVVRVIKVTGMVNCTPDFDQQPAVINGCSQLLADVFGTDAGIGTRSAFGVAALPLGVPVEIEAVLEIS